ncbi:hypothetical protein [Pukyongiella litopenaei]|uniref:Uncharacterized protein n=1 Tax=Pukyongiella litopenaei TaxID=2605946 RepID=A0A2S0MN51_9RHOB|nr:hypothetical protein [Pukyongiella litopenaei]AVO37310.1 hypothetical protein C6Y53_06020 [Pukyongiella litopenaei]
MNALRKRVARQTGDERKSMLLAFRNEVPVTAMQLNDWLAGKDNLTEEQLDMLKSWITGEFGYMSTRDGIQLLKRQKNLPPVVFTNPPAGPRGPSYKPGSPRLGQKPVSPKPKKNSSSAPQPSNPPRSMLDAFKGRRLG